MDFREPLMATKRLKTGRLGKLRGKKHHIYFRYDKTFDALTILFISPDTETVVHYIDEQVALLYEPKAREIVGLQVEDFVHSFLPRHDQVRRVWRLSEAIGKEVRFKDFEDMILAIEKRKRMVAKEVFRASEKILERQVPRLVQPFRESIATSTYSAV